MKKILNIVAVALSMTAAAQNAEMKIDTVKTVDSASEVIITETANGLNVNIKNAGKPDSVYTYSSHYAPDVRVKAQQDTSNWELRLPFSKSKNSSRHWEVVSDGWSAGLSMAVGAPSDVDISMGGSWEFSWLNMLSLRYYPTAGKSCLSVGVGLTGQNYRLGGNSRFVKAADGSIGVGDYGEGEAKNYSQLSVLSLNFPVLWRQHIYKDLSFRTGVILNYNYYASIKTRYEMKGVRYTESTHGLRQKKFTLDLMGCISWDAIGWFVKYSPMNVMDKGYGPQFKSVSTGLMLFF